VRRTVIPDTPIRVEYALTDKGRALEPAIRALGEWAEKWLGGEQVGDDALPAGRAKPAAAS
jgi:DNA-binding HxlR family transcriptional regulator